MFRQTYKFSPTKTLLRLPRIRKRNKFKSNARTAGALNFSPNFGHIHTYFAPQKA